MADAKLNRLKVAILATEGVERIELTEPRKALEKAGAEVKLVSPKNGAIRSWEFTDWGEEIAVDVPLAEANPVEFDALLLPGINPDKLRLEPTAIEFGKTFFDAGKPVAAICHGPWMVIEGGGARGRHMTSWPSPKTDLIDAGAEWSDRETVVDGNLATSRKPDDIPAFSCEMIQLFQKARPARQRDLGGAVDLQLGRKRRIFRTLRDLHRGNEMLVCTFKSGRARA